MFDVVKTVRQKPFGEWNVVYFDATKIDTEKLLERLRKNGCEKAQHIEAASGGEGDARVEVENPIAAPGDFFVVSVTAPEKAKAGVVLTAPEGWTLPSGPKATLKKGLARLDLQAPKDAKGDTYTLKATVTVDGESAEIEVKVQVVDQVR